MPSWHSADLTVWKEKMVCSASCSRGSWRSKRGPVGYRAGSPTRHCSLANQCEKTWKTSTSRCRLSLNMRAAWIPQPAFFLTAIRGAGWLMTWKLDHLTRDKDDMLKRYLGGIGSNLAGSGCVKPRLARRPIPIRYRTYSCPG